MSTWMKYETRVRTHPKIAETIKETGHANAAWLWFAGNAYSRDALTDGFIADAMLSTLVPSLPARVLKGLPDVLVRHGLWHREEGGYRIHDFLDLNPSKAEVESKRKADRDRKRGGIHEDSARNPDGVPVDSVRVLTRVTPAGAGSLSPLSSSEGVQGKPSPEPFSKPRHGDPHGFRPDPHAAALIDLGGGRAVSIPESWASKARREYGLSFEQIDEFARWCGTWAQRHGFEDGGKRLAWLDTRLAEWRATRRAAQSSDDDIQRTQAFLREQEAHLAEVSKIAPETLSKALWDGFHGAKEAK